MTLVGIEFFVVIWVMIGIEFFVLIRVMIGIEFFVLIRVMIMCYSKTSLLHRFTSFPNVH